MKLEDPDLSRNNMSKPHINIIILLREITASSSQIVRQLLYIQRILQEKSNLIYITSREGLQFQKPKHCVRSPTKKANIRPLSTKRTNA